jgi:multidrug efflux pump subunit AcrB
MIPTLEAELKDRFPQALSIGKKFRLGPGDGGRVQVRVQGSDPIKMREITTQIEDILHADGRAKGVRLDWRQQVKKLVPRIAEEQANINGITREDISGRMLSTFEGAKIGVYRERDELLPIVLRAPAQEREDIASSDSLQIWSPIAQSYLPIRQVVSSFDSAFENQIVMRRDRKPTMTVHADPTDGNSNDLLARIDPLVQAIELPPGYEIQYGGEYESSSDAQAALAGSIPVFILLMVLVVVMLFNALRQPLIIWLCVPLALIGVTAGLLATNQPFGFMALLGFMSLSGMLIKNAIVLIDQIDVEIREGNDPGPAIIDSAVSRLRPVAMAAITTVLGMIPLLADAFFVAMAVTIMAGLTFATLLTMVLVPVLYATFFNIPTPDAPQA